MNFTEKFLTLPATGRESSQDTHREAPGSPSAQEKVELMTPQSGLGRDPEAPPRAIHRTFLRQIPKKPQELNSVPARRSAPPER